MSVGAKGGDAGAMLAPELGLEGVAPEVRELVKRGEFTAELYERDHKGECDVVAFLFSDQKMSIRALSRQFARSQNTIRAMLVGRGLLGVDALRGELRESLLLGARGLAARVAADPEAVPNSQVPMLLDVLIRNAQLLDGGPTEIVESRRTVRVEDWNEALRQAREGRVGQTMEAEAHVVGDAQIGLEGEKMGALPAAADDLVDPSGRAAPGAEVVLLMCSGDSDHR